MQIAPALVRGSFSPPEGPVHPRVFSERADVEKGKDTSVLGNGDEEDVEKNDQGWPLGWATNLGGAAGRGACSLPNSPLCISSPTSSSLLLSIVRLIIIIFSCHSHPQHCRLSVLSL